MKRMHRWQHGGWLLAAAVMWGGAVWAAPIPKDMTREQLKQSILKNPATYDLARSTWRAEEIKPAGKLPAADAKPNAGFRKVVFLPEAPEDAALTILKFVTYRLYINGTLVPPPAVRDDFGVTLAELAGYFKKGSNVVTVVSACYANAAYPNPILLLEGAVRCKSGQIVRILSDTSWKAAYNPSEGCEQPAFDDQAWTNALSNGKPSTLVGYTIDGRNGGMLSPPYYGPIELTKPHGERFFIYDFGKPVKIPLTVYAHALEGGYDIRWRLTQAETEEEAARGSLKEGQSGARAYKSDIELSVPKPGVYELFVELVQNGRVQEVRIEEIAVVGKIAQREVAGANYLDGLELELVDEVDCTDTNSAYRLFSQTATGQEVESPIVESSLGKYREANGIRNSWFGFAVKVAKLGQPYLVEVEIPDDKARNIGIRPIQLDGAVAAMARLNDGYGLLGMSPGSGGIYTGEDHPLTGKMLVERMIVFVKSPVLGIQLATLEAGRPAAAGKVRIYRITNDLPAAKIASPVYRYTGQHLERYYLMPYSYYAGADQFRFAANCNIPHRGSYKNWFNTGVNMVKYLRFVGETMIDPGLYMYYPDNSPSWRNRETDVSLPLLGRILAANGCALQIGVEYGQTAFTNRYATMMDKDGRPATTWVNTPNLFDPVVQDDMRRFIDDLGCLYGECPGVAGITMMVGLGLLPDISYSSQTSGATGMDNPLYLGYDDITIGLFEKDTGIIIPEVSDQKSEVRGQNPESSIQHPGAKDPSRFKARYEWLMANKKEQWIEWRNRSVYAFSAELARIARRHNPQWKLSMIVQCLPNRMYSFDPDSFRKDRNMLFGSRLTQDVRPGGEWVRHRQNAESPDIIRVADDGASLISMGFYEPGVSSETWYWKFFLPCDHVAPSGRAYLREYAKLMSYATPQILVQTWNDGSIMTGHEQIRREFNRAFCVLPPGPYRTLTGNGLDKNLVVRLGPMGKTQTPFYVINPGAWPVSVTLTVNLGQGAMVKDLVTGAELIPEVRGQKSEVSKIENRKSKIENNEFRLSLNSYELRSLAIVGRGEVTGAATAIAPEAQAAVKKLALAKAEICAWTDKIGEAKIAKGLDAVGWEERATNVMALSRQVVEAARTGDYLTAANLTDSYMVQKFEGFVLIMRRYMEDVKELTNSCFYVDCGATNCWIDPSGRVWLADQDWNGGAATWGVAGGNIVDRGKLKLEGAAPGLAPIYQTERFAVKQYCFRLTKGAYKVRLHFMEAWCKNPGERIFNVAIQGKPVLEKFDIFKEAGGANKVLVKEFAADVTDELLEIAFLPDTDATLINGVEVIKAGQ